MLEESPNKFISQEKYYLISHKNKKLEEIIKKYENFLLSNNINPKTILDSSNQKIVISKVINYSKDGKNNIRNCFEGTRYSEKNKSYYIDKTRNTLYYLSIENCAAKNCRSHIVARLSFVVYSAGDRGTIFIIQFFRRS